MWWNTALQSKPSQVRQLQLIRWRSKSQLATCCLPVQLGSRTYAGAVYLHTRITGTQRQARGRTVHSGRQHFGTVECWAHLVAL